MRKSVTAAIVAAIAFVATPALAQDHDHGNGGGGDRHAAGDHGMGDRNGPAMRAMPMDHGGPGMAGGHHFANGGRFNPGWAPGYRTVGAWQHYHLRRPPHGYHWVWYDGNFMLVAIGSGIIASMIAGAYD